MVHKLFAQLVFLVYVHQIIDVPHELCYDVRPEEEREDVHARLQHALEGRPGLEPQVRRPGDLYKESWESSRLAGWLAVS